VINPRGSAIPAANVFGRDQIRENVLLKQYYCDVDVGHLISFNEELAHRLVTEPAEIIPLVRRMISSKYFC
jgi:DNA replicative helicase MCM subunit Mcm2 (Cdc46/Mcm family)